MMETLSDIHGRTILVVDDIPTNLAVAVDYLEDNNFQVMVAQDGEEGVERAQLIRPDLILLDVMMPGIDGFETCRRLKMIESTRDIPVIFMTALNGTSDTVKGFSAGAVDYVTKPFQVEELLARIKTHLTLRAAQKQLVMQNTQLQASEIRYRRLFETAQDGILLLDFESGQVTNVNVSVVNMLGYSRDHYLNRKLWDIQPFEDIPACQPGLAELQTRGSVSFEHWPLAAQDKSLVDVEFVGNVYEVDGARIVQCNIRNITDRKQAEARIRYMALHDALTGLPNRILFKDRLTQAIRLAHRNRERVVVLMLDLDHFKHINDTLGHHIGDGLLEAASKRLKACIRESDIVARLGGDEFVIAFPAVPEDQNIENVVKNLLASLREPFQVEGHELQVSGSIGISQFPGDGENPATLLRAADTAMYAAKANARGSYSFFTPELNVATQRRLMLAHDLHHACIRGEFVLHYQPQVSTNSGAITAVEALLRWNHPQHGLISPAEFIPLLEELGLIIQVGNWVLKTACLQNVAWQKEGLSPVRMAVNVSAHQFYRGDLVRTVEEALRESQLNPKWLELELTETLTLDDSETTIGIMHELKRHGVALSLDDFGTGWSSLSCLRRFPLDRIKIDRSFMRDITTQPAAKAVVTSIIDLARNLGLTCIAEGVETVEQLDYLEKKQCADIQGFLYSPALPALDCGALMRSGNPSFMIMPNAIASDVYGQATRALGHGNDSGEDGPFGELVAHPARTAPPHAM
jgi:diguanylate cyclase (GGDEF)-like protein/PAS domain S-box-containing protein